MGLKTGNRITYNDLLYGLLLCSGNDAAIQISVSIAGTIEDFSKMMNEKAKELGLKNTNFVTPHGLDKEEHYTTAFELAKMADYAMNIEKFKEVVGTKTYTVTINGNPKTISNTNELLGNLEGVNGVKTGFTNGAGRCLVTSVERSGFNIITVVLGADTKKIRTKDSINLIEYIYKNYEIVNLKEIIENKFEEWKLINESRTNINKGTKEELNVKLGNIKYNCFPVKIKEKDKIFIEVNSINYIEAPVLENELIGELYVEINGEIIDRIDILNSETIKKKNVLDYLKLLIERNALMNLTNN